MAVETAAKEPDLAGGGEGGGRAEWVRRPWCVWLAVGLVLLGLVSNATYLWNNCPIDLSEDESHYWEWSRHLDYGYYSKPPGIAWVIWAAIRIGTALGVTGDGSGAALMPVMRMAAVVFGCLSGLLSLFLARRMFRDDRAALAVIVLSGAVPMFAVGSLLITIDSPMYLCWAATVYCLWRAVEGGERSDGAKGRRSDGGGGGSGSGGGRGGVGWLYGAGLACAVGMMFKPVLIALPLCVLVAVWADVKGGAIRRAFATWHTAGAGFLVLLSQVPVVIWNAQHNWVTFRHVLTQGGFGQQAGGPPKNEWWRPLARLGEYIGGQAGGMGGVMFVLVVIAVIVAFQKIRGKGSAAGIEPSEARVEGGVGSGGRSWPAATPYRFLLAFSLPLWGFYLAMNLWKRTEVNWPAASYFAAMILLAGVFVEMWNSTIVKERKAWRVWGTIAVVWGFLMTAAAMNLQRFYPFVARQLEAKQGTPAYFKSPFHPTKWDQPTVRLRGLKDRASLVHQAAQKLAVETGSAPLIITGRYDTSSSLAFYMPGHPFVYSLMSKVGGRQSQYDVWPGLEEVEAGPGGEQRLKHLGKNALIVGGFEPWAMEQVIRASFERVEGPETHTTVVNGVALKDVLIYRAYGFKGLPNQAGRGGVY